MPWLGVSHSPEQLQGSEAATVYSTFALGDAADLEAQESAGGGECQSLGVVDDERAERSA